LARARASAPASRHRAVARRALEPLRDLRPKRLRIDPEPERVPPAARPGAGDRRRQIPPPPAREPAHPAQGAHAPFAPGRAVPPGRHHHHGETAMRSFAALGALALVALLPLEAAAQAPGNVVKLATLVPDGSVWDKVLKGMGAEWSTATQGRVS